MNITKGVLNGLISWLSFASILGCNSVETSVIPALPGPTIRPSGIPSGFMRELQTPERKTSGVFTRATERFGTLFVSEGSFDVILSLTPWSSSWYPMSDNSLFSGSDSPLQKYDLFASSVRGTNTLSVKSAEYHAKHFFNPDFAPWAGWCDAWALASVMELEPLLKEPVKLTLPTSITLDSGTSRERKVEEIQITTADLKALIVQTYGNIPNQEQLQFGQRFNGDYQSIPDDIYPDQFHKLIQVELFKKKHPVIMDKDPGVEVWNVPVFKVSTEIRRDHDPYLMHVKTALIGGVPDDPAPDPSIHLNSWALYDYTYDLYGYPMLDGSLKVVYGVWTGQSIQDHPDFIWTVPDVENQKARKSRNPEIDVQVVEDLISRALKVH